MKKILFVIVCVCMISVVAFSQQRRSPEEMASQTTEWMKTELKLTADQATKVEAINKAMAKERSALIEKAGGDFSSVRDDMQKLNDKTVEEFKKVLTKEQLEAYQKQAAERRRGPR
jgi:hypothetical protein